MNKKQKLEIFPSDNCPISLERLGASCENVSLHIFLDSSNDSLSQVFEKEYGSFVFIVEKHDFPEDSFSLYLFHHPNETFEQFCYGIEAQKRKDLLIHFGSVACFMAEKEKKKKKELDLSTIVKDAVKVGKEFYDSNSYIGKPWPIEERGKHKAPWQTNEDICVEVLYLKGNFYANFFCD